MWPSVKLLDISPRWSGLSVAASPGPAAAQFADAQLRSSTVALGAAQLSLVDGSGRPGSERSQLWPSVRLLDSSPRWSLLFAAWSSKAPPPFPLTVVC